MSELAGQITYVVPAPFGVLWALVGLPVLAAGVVAIAGERVRARLVWIAASVAAATGVLAVWASVVLLRVVAPVVEGGAPPRTALYAYAYPLVRSGSLDVPLALSLDRLGALLALAVALGGGAALAAGAVVAGRDAAKSGGAVRFVGGASAAIGSLMLVVTADNAVLMLAGWIGTGIAAGILTGFSLESYERVGEAVRAFVGARIGELALVAGITLLFWGLGGEWLAGDRFSADYRARFVAVETAKGGAAPVVTIPKTAGGVREDLLSGKGRLTQVTYPGARVFLGINSEAELGPNPTPFAVAPFFETPLPAGLHKIAVLPGRGATVGGDGNESGLVDVLEVRANSTYSVVPIGPTLTFREIDDQLGLRNAEGKPLLWFAFRGKSTFAPTTDGGVRLATVVGLLFLLAALARAGQWPFGAVVAGSSKAAAPAMAVVLGLVAVVPGALLLVRFHYLYAPGDSAAIVLGSVATVGAVLAAVRALRARTTPELLPWLVVSQLGLVAIGIATGAVGAALGLAVHVALSTVAVGATLIVTHARLRAAALVWAAGIVPLGGFWARHDIARTALAADEQGVWALLWFALGLLVAGAVAFAATRHALAALAVPATLHVPAKKAKKKVKPPSTVAIVVAGVAVGLAVLGSTLVCLPGFLLGRDGTLLHGGLRLAGTGAAVPAGGTWLAAVSLVVVAGAASAARRYPTPAKKSVLPAWVEALWLRAEGLQARADAAAFAVRRVAMEVDERVLDLAPGLLSSGVAAGWTHVRAALARRAWAVMIVAIGAVALVVSMPWWLPS